MIFFLSIFFLFYIFFFSNIFLIKNRLLNYFPMIENINFKRSLFGNLNIEINEKTPILIALSESKYLYLDSKGEVLDIVEDIKKLNIPIFSDIFFDNKIEIGQILVKKELKNVIDLINEIPENKKHFIKEISIIDGLIIIYNASNYKIILGDNNNIIKKLNILETLLNDSNILKKGIEYIDISIPNRPIIKNI